MREVRTGIWHWETPHPDWAGPENEALRRRLADASNAAARGVVSSYAIEEDERLLLFDPLAVPREVEALAAGRDQVVVLTCPWHERDTRKLVERLGVRVFTPRPDEGSPDVAWLLDSDRNDAHLYTAGERLLVGVEALPGRLPNDAVLWVESRCAVIAGDTLVDFGQGLEIAVEWLPEGITRGQVAEGLRSLLEVPVEAVLATHGGPTGKTALERALA
jgi:glyoxylase-like metal-dependent hydrolase (beta-lactamase superfamily II)